MESTFISLSHNTSSAMSILSLTKSINSHSAPLLLAQLNRRLSSATRPIHLAQLGQCIQLSRLGQSHFVRSLGSVNPRRTRLRLAASYSTSFGGGGIDGGAAGGGGGGGGGDGAAEGGDAKPVAVAAGGGGDGAGLSSDVIILDVGGMTCGGCAASVKRILESQPQVSSASVNLTTETAIVWPVSEAKAAPNWRQNLGEALAKHLTSCGFNSNLRDEGANDGDIQL